MTAMMIDDGKRVAAGGARLQWHMIPIADIDLIARNTRGEEHGIASSPGEKMGKPTSRHLTFELLRNQQRSLRVGKSRRLPKIENKVVPAPARVGFPVDFESMVRCITHNALIGPGGRENILVLRERE